VEERTLRSFMIDLSSMNRSIIKEIECCKKC